MRKYFKLFNTHEEYEAYTADTSSFIKPNVSYCIDTPIEVHYNPLRCDETTVYEIIGTPSYPSAIEGDATSFDITVNYRRTDTDLHCKETVIEGTDTIRVECGANPSTASSRTVSGTVEWNGNEIEYSVTQNKLEIVVIGNFNVTSTTSPTQIANATTGFSKIEIDGVEEPSVVSAYTFNTKGGHTVKYYLNGTSIGYKAFAYCARLTNCIIGNGVTSIGADAFVNCTHLTSIVIPSGVISIDNYAFYQCSGLTSIDIPSGVTSIGYSAFESCTSITSCTIESGTIGDRAFINCYGLTSVTIGSGVTSIGELSFSYCSGLTSITSNAITAPTIQSKTFKSVKTNGTLYVSIGSSGYDVWMGTGDYYLGKYNWTKVEQ